MLDTDGQTATSISKYGLETMEFLDERRSLAWDRCTLRTWLRSTFLNNAFTAEEQVRLQTAAVTVPLDPGFGVEHTPKRRTG